MLNYFCFAELTPFPLLRRGFPLHQGYQQIHPTALQVVNYQRMSFLKSIAHVSPHEKSPLTAGNRKKFDNASSSCSLNSMKQKFGEVPFFQTYSFETPKR